MKRGTRDDEKYVKKNFLAKVNALSEKVPFIRDAKAMYRYMFDPEVHWSKKSVAVGALAYFIFPLDAIPDMTPIVGYLDDAGVISAAVAYLASELEPYYVG